MPRVDIIVPCHNYGHFLETCVKSALSQEGVDVRILVIDDGSTDASASVASELARLDARVRLISLAKNVGMIQAVNYGLRELEAEYFVKLDADDLLSPGSLQRSVALLERYPNVGFIYGRVRHFKRYLPSHAWGPRLTLGFAAEWLAVRGLPYATIWPGIEWLALQYRGGRNPICQPEAMIRTSSLRAVGEYNVGLAHTSDLEMWLRLAAVSDVCRINLVDQGYYRVHANSMQRTINAGLLTDLIGRREAFVRALSTTVRRNVGANDLETLVRKHLASEALEYACRALDRCKPDSAPITELVEFASTTYPSAATLPEWHGLLRRRQRRLLSPWAPSNFMSLALMRCRDEIVYLRRFRTGN